MTDDQARAVAVVLDRAEQLAKPLDRMDRALIRVNELLSWGRVCSSHRRSDRDDR